MSGDVPPLISLATALLLALLSYFAINAQQDVVRFTGYLGVGLLLVAVFEGAFREWDRWAPNDQPRLIVEREDYVGTSGFIVTNDDIDGRYRGQVVDVLDEHGERPAWRLNRVWPMDIGWGDHLDPEIHLVRGQSAKVQLVRYGLWDNEPHLIFMGPHGLVHRLPALTQTFEVHVVFARVEPKPSLRPHVERFAFRLVNR